LEIFVAATKKGTSMSNGKSQALNSILAQLEESHKRHFILLNAQIGLVLKVVKSFGYNGPELTNKIFAVDEGHEELVALEEERYKAWVCLLCEVFHEELSPTEGTWDSPAYIAACRSLAADAAISAELSAKLQEVYEAGEETTLPIEDSLSLFFYRFRGTYAEGPGEWIYDFALQPTTEEAILEEFLMSGTPELGEFRTIEVEEVKPPVEVLRKLRQEYAKRQSANLRIEAEFRRLEELEISPRPEGDRNY
jgi:hypothetical protein